MSCWFEVFDNEEVQLTTRRKVTVLGVIVASASLLTLLCAAASFSGHMSRVGAFFLIGGVWLATAFWCGYRLRMLRRVAWCLKISEEALVAYDYARKKTVIPWSRVSKVEWTAHSLLISGPPPCSIEIPDVFADFAALSHTIYERADRAHVAVYIEGTPVTALRLHRLYPFLREMEITSEDRDTGGLTALDG